MAVTPYRILTRHFLRGYFENDLLSPDEGLVPTLASLLAAIAAPGLLLPMVWSFSYGWPYKRTEEYTALVVRHEVLLVLLPMVVVALVTVLQWASLYPDRRDAEVLGRLPVRLHTVFGAKVTALAWFVGLFALAANAIPSVLYPVVANIRTQPGAPGVWATFVAHACATFGGAAFAALAVLAVLGVLQAALPARALRVVSPLAQMGAVFVLVLAFLMLPFLMMAVDPHGQGRLSELVALHRLYAEEDRTFDWNEIPASSAFEPDPVRGGMRPRDPLARPSYARVHEAFAGEPLRTAFTQPPGIPDAPPAWLFWCPPVWYLGWYETLAGRGGPSTRLLAERAQAGLVLAALVAGVCYLLAYRRHLTGAVLGGGGGPRQAGAALLPRAAAAAGRLVVRDPAARAYFSFALATARRSASHRLLIVAAAGVGLALVLAEAAVGATAASRADGRPSVEVLSAQFVLIICLTGGARLAFAVPSVLRANWTFQLHGPDTADACREGTRRMLLCCGVAPILLLLLPVHVLLYGWAAAAGHGAFGLVAALVLVEILLAGFPKVPFASSYVPGRSRIRSRLTLYVFGFQTFAYVLAWIESFALGSPTGYGALLAVALLAYGSAVRRRRLRTAGERLVYDEDPPDAIQTLSLAGPGVRHAA